MRNAWRPAPLLLVLLATDARAADPDPAPPIDPVEMEPDTTLRPGPAADLLTSPSRPSSGGATPNPLGMGLGGGAGGPGYDVRGYFARPADGPPGDLALVRQNLSAAVPIWRDGPDLLLANVRLRNLNVGTAAVLPDTGQRFPENLWDVGLGLTAVRKLDNGWTAGVMGSIGSASNNPFHGLREMTLSAVGFLKIPARREADSWTFMLAYSPNGQLAFPLPLARYDWNPSDRLSVGVGLPLSVRWAPTDTWRFDLSYAPLTTVNAKATWSPHEWVSVFGGFEWDSEGYFLVERRERQDRFFYLEKRLVGGVRVGGLGRAVLTVSGGYAFDRSFGAGRSPLDFKYDVVDVSPGPFLGGLLSLKF